MEEKYSNRYKSTQCPRCQFFFDAASVGHMDYFKILSPIYVYAKEK